MTFILSTDDGRSSAAALIDRFSSGYRTDGHFVAEVLDAVSADLLRLAGVADPVEARKVMTALWGRSDAPAAESDG